MNNQPTLEKYAFSVLFGPVILMAIGFVVGEIAGTGFGDPFVFLISLVFILPIIALAILLGYPVFEWIISSQIRVQYLLKVAIAGFLSGIIPLIIFAVGYALLTGPFGDLQEFLSLLIVLIGLSIPFVLCSSVAYAFVDTRL